MKNISATFILLISAYYTHGQTAVQEALNKINFQRKKCGLDTVAISAQSSMRCIKHAKYLAINHPALSAAAANPHDENIELKGYSKDGRIAAKNSGIAWSSPTEAVNMFISSLYHRIPLLQPDIREIGIGYFADPTVEITVIDYNSDIGANYNPIEVVFCPAKDQEYIPLKLENEEPYPVEESLRENFTQGFPITACFTQDQDIDSVTFLLLKDTTEVPVFLSTPKQQATIHYQGNTICAIPKEKLIANTMYTVQLACAVNGVPRKFEYRFKTAQN